MANSTAPTSERASDDQKRPRASFVWPHIRELVARMPGVVATVAIASFLAAIAEASILAILAQGALLLANHASRVHLDLGPLHAHTSLAMLLAVGVGLAVARLGLAIVTSFVPALISDHTQARLRSELFAAFTNASWAVQSRDREGHLQELMTNQIYSATQAYTTAAGLIVSMLTLLVLIISAVALNVLAAASIIVVAGVLSVLLRPLGVMGHRRSEAVSRGWLAYAGGVNEAVRVAEEAHVFGAGAAQRTQHDALMSVFRRPNLQTIWLAGLVPSLYQGFIYMLLLVGLIVLHALDTGHIASLGAVVLLLIRSGSYGQQTQTYLQILRQSQPYVERLRDTERRYTASAPVDGQRTLASVDTLSASEVSLSYGRDRPALSDISFDVSANETIGIIGPSGAGKSTLVQILLGLRRPDSGIYLVNGTPAYEFKRADWRRQFAYVPQEPRLLHASVGDNIRFFRDVDDDSVERAARLAGIHEEVISWPRGYETTIGPRADGISGGQRQRICLARALAAHPQVLVLDEPTSALDPRAEQLIQDSLRGLKNKLTLFIVAHRMSTLEFCERVMVVVDGRLEAFDDVAELRATNPYYQEVMPAVAPGAHGRSETRS